MDAVPALSPGFGRPTHLHELVAELDKVPYEPIRVIADVPPRHFKPVHEDTPVTMADGSMRPIRDLVVGDRVVSGAGRLTTVTGTYSQGELDVLRIVTRTGREIVAEWTHQFLTQRGWIQAGGLRPVSDAMTLRHGGFECETQHDPIVSVEPAGRARCVCITVADDESFLANNFVTHNSTTIHHWLAKILAEHPWLKILYVTYGSEFAAENVEAIRDLAIAAGVVIGRTDRENKFTTKQGGCVVGAGFDGILTGRGYHVIVVDDAHKSRKEAESRATRTKVVRGVKSDVFSRRQPGGRLAVPRGFRGTSIVVIGTRWHVDDVQGNLLGTSPALPRRTRKSKWKHIHLPAINEKGEALAPDYWPLEALEEIKSDFEDAGQLADWLSLYQGDPQSEDGQKFRDIMLIARDAIPSSGRRGIGVDLSHTSKTRSDNHAVATMQRTGDAYYLLNVVGKKMPLTRIDHPDGRREPGFVQYVRAEQQASPGARTVWHIGGPEDTTAELLGKLEPDERVHIEAIRTQIDKLQRAIAFIKDWNAGKIFVPDDADWASPLMSKLISFRGLPGDADDEIDAIITAHWILSQSDGLNVLTASSSGRGEPIAPAVQRPRRGRGVFI